MGVSLVVARGARKGAVVPVAGRFLIGRLPRCQLRPASLAISRKHCSIQEYEDGTVTVQDLGSANGTYLNGARIDGEVEIRHGDRLRVGPLVFSVRIDTVVGEEDLAGDLLLEMDREEEHRFELIDHQ